MWTVWKWRTDLRTNSRIKFWQISQLEQSEYIWDIYVTSSGLRAGNKIRKMYKLLAIMSTCFQLGRTLVYVILLHRRDATIPKLGSYFLWCRAAPTCGFARTYIPTYLTLCMWKKIIKGGRLPSKFVFCPWLSSLQGRLPSKVLLHPRMSSILGHLPSKVIFHPRSFSLDWWQPLMENDHWW